MGLTRQLRQMPVLGTIYTVFCWLSVPTLTYYFYWLLSKLYFWRPPLKTNAYTIKTILVLVYIPGLLFFYTNYWLVWGIVKYKPLTDKYLNILLPYASKTQTRIETLFQSNVNPTAASNPLFRWPIYKLLWYVYCGPPGELLFGIWLVILVINSITPGPLSAELNEYTRQFKIPSHRELKKALASTERGDHPTYLGYNLDSKQAGTISNQDRKEHIQIIGPTGSGKTHFVILPMIAQDIRQGRGIIFIDAKGDLTNAKTLYKLCCDAGREQDFLMFSTNYPAQSNPYNPLALGNATQLKDKLIGGIEFSEPHYKRECETALQLLFTEWVSTHGRNLVGTNNNQSAIADYLLSRDPSPITLPRLCKILQTPPTDMPEFTAFYETHRKNISGIQNEISLLVNTPFGYLFNDELRMTNPVASRCDNRDKSVGTGDGLKVDDEFQKAVQSDISHLSSVINLLDVYRNKKVVYFAINTLTYGTTGKRLGKLITGDLNTLCGLIQTMDSGLRTELAIYIDEYGEFGTPSFANTLSQGRSAGFMITVAHQSIGDLTAISPEHPDKVRANTKTRILLPGVEQDTIDHFCTELGTYKSVKTTVQDTLDGTVIEQQLGTRRAVDEYIIKPQWIRQLGRGDHLRGNHLKGYAFYKTPQEYGQLYLQGKFVDTDKITLPVRQSVSNVAVPPAISPGMSGEKVAKDKTQSDIPGKDINSFDQL